MHGLSPKTLQVFHWLPQEEKTHRAGEVLEEGRTCRRFWWGIGRAESCQKLRVHGSSIPPGRWGQVRTVPGWRINPAGSGGFWGVRSQPRASRADSSQSFSPLIATFSSQTCPVLI